MRIIQNIPSVRQVPSKAHSFSRRNTEPQLLLTILRKTLYSYSATVPRCINGYRGIFIKTKSLARLVLRQKGKLNSATFQLADLV